MLILLGGLTPLWPDRHRQWPSTFRNVFQSSEIQTDVGNHYIHQLRPVISSLRGSSAVSYRTGVDSSEYFTISSGYDHKYPRILLS